MNFLVLLLFPLLFVNEIFSEKITDEEKAADFLEREDRLYRDTCWGRTNNDTISDELTIHSFAWKNFTDPLIKREFKLLSKDEFENTDWALLIKLAEIVRNITDTYTKARVSSCDSINGTAENEERKHSLRVEPDLRKIFEYSRDYNELKCYWISWREATGKLIRKAYPSCIENNNNIARLNGYSNMNDWWMDELEIENIFQETDRLYQQILPLYKELHSYIRRRLRQFYGSELIREDGPIPSHLIGDVRTINWMGIENIIRPFPNKPSLDTYMNVKNLTVMDMIRRAENIYLSMGFSPLDDRFWNMSTFEESTQERSSCIQGLHDECAGRLFKVEMCAQVDNFYLDMMYRAFSYVFYAREYKSLHRIFQRSANRAFDKAVANAILLSASTPNNLQRNRLVDFENETAFSINLNNAMLLSSSSIQNELEDFQNDTSKEQEINILMANALKILPEMLNAYVVLKWRYQVFNSSIPFENMNKMWWQYRLQYQGLCPPIRRTEDDFDPASLPRVSYSNLQIQDLFAGILQFQFYKGLCEASGYFGPLHLCDIKGSLAAGNRLRKMMKMGRTKPWPEALSVITNGTKEMNGQILLEYFQPLYNWLKIQNQNETTDWHSNDATVCP